MVEVWLPYGRTEVVMRVPDENLRGIIDTNMRERVANPTEEIYSSIDNPLKSSKKLEDVVTTGKKIAIVVDDNTRPSPTRLILTCLLEKMTNLGVLDHNVKVIFGCGAHRMTTEEGLAIIGDELRNRINIEIHNSYAKDLVYVGDTSRGTPLFINKSFQDSDVRILTGDIGFHYFAGYGGGRKSVLPAIVGIDTIRKNHSHLLNPKARTGNLDGNPIHLDMEEALQLVNVDFALNVVLNSQKEMVKAFFGDVDKVFLRGVQLVDEMCKVSVESRAEVVVVSSGGYPYDLDLYQAYKGIDAALNVVENKGVIILIAECSEGYSNKAFHDWMIRFKNLSRIKREIKRNFVLGGHKAYYLARALEKTRIILVSIMPNYYATGVFKLRTAQTANSALRLALRMTGRKSQILIIPHGSSTLPLIH